MTNEKQKPQLDWQQVVLNGGPPCFFVEGPQYCGRAERWGGHGNKSFHDYVSLADLLTTVRADEREAAWNDAITAASDYVDSYAFRTYDKTSGNLVVAALERAVENRKGEG